MPSLAEILKNKKDFSDDHSLTLANGEKFTIGELRTLNDATQGELAKQLQAERDNLSKEREVLTKAQQEVVDLWTKISSQGGDDGKQRQQQQQGSWMDDPILSPIANHLKSTYDPKLDAVSKQIEQFQKALATGVKYIVDRFVESDYRTLSNDFRKETSLEQAVRLAQEKKYFDAGGAPDVRKVYADWEAPRREKSIYDSAYEKAKNDILSEQRQQAVIDMKPGFFGNKENAAAKSSSSFAEALNKGWSDPEILSKIQN